MSRDGVERCEFENAVEIFSFSIYFNLIDLLKEKDFSVIYIFNYRRVKKNHQYLNPFPHNYLHQN